MDTARLAAIQGGVIAARIGEIDRPVRRQMRHMVIDHEQRSRVGQDRNMQPRFRIAMPAVAVIQPLRENPHPADRETARQLGVNMLEIGAGEIRIEFTEIDFRNQILARLLDIAIIAAQPVAPRQVVFRPFGLTWALRQGQGGKTRLLHAAHEVGAAQAFLKRRTKPVDIEGEGKPFNAGPGNETGDRFRFRW